MAPDLRRWLLAAGLGCATIAAAYLPPPIREPRQYMRDLTPEQWWEARTNSALTRNRTLLRATERAEVLRQEMRRAGGRPGMHVVLPGRVAPAIEQRIRTRLDQIWKATVPGGGTVPFVFVLDGVAGGRRLWILPGAAPDRKTCGVIMPIDPNGGGVLNVEWYVAWAMSKCAYFSAFGMPGTLVDAWLARRHYDFASSIAWDGDTTSDLFDREAPAIPRVLANVMYFGVINGNPQETACARNRADQCRLMILGDFTRFNDATAPPGTVGGGNMRWAGNDYLAALIRDRGRDRFGQFWRSEKPVDQAFVDAFGMELETWTAQWNRQHLFMVPPSTMPGAPSFLVAIVVLGALVAAVAARANSRQVT